jgi:simple sugar transport system permease protein
MNLILAYLVVTRRANQLASGLALMFLGVGLSALIGKSFVGAKITGLPRFLLPGLSNLPTVFSSLFRFDILIILCIPVAFLVWWVLFRTRWGLSLRAVGENADTAFASGRNPFRIRYQALFVGGLLAGMGAAHLSIAYTMNWGEYMTGGRGFIAIALVIFSKWHPLRAIVGALLFSAAVAFQLLLQSSGVQVSPFLLDMIPYFVTLIVLMIWGGTRRQSAPASLGRVYQGTE